MCYFKFTIQLQFDAGFETKKESLVTELAQQLGNKINQMPAVREKVEWRSYDVMSLK